ncbi:MAG: hypothetical protein KAW09_03210 [Thermoplasmata archaeon]|nr:hypothetical protein [Thermoplasmata archaeon]
MSRFIEILNTIKRNFGRDWLTPSQESVLGDCMRFLGSYFLVNIYGENGVGKTFLGWVMAKEGLASYFPSYGEFKGAEDKLRTVIIDECKPERRFVRSVRDMAIRKGLDSVILISEKEADPDVPSFQLELTADDIKCVKGNLWRHNMLVDSEKHIANLKELVMVAEVK